MKYPIPYACQLASFNMCMCCSIPLMTLMLVLLLVMNALLVLLFFNLLNWGSAAPFI